MRIFKSILLVSIVSVFTSPVLAQSGGETDAFGFPAPSADGVTTDGGEQQRAPVATPMAAPVPMQPTGGFATVPPSPGAQDPANRMTLDGGEAYVETLVNSADERLADLSPAEVSPETASVLERMMQARLNNMFLEIKQEEAELAVGLWGVLYNNEHAQAWRQREATEAAARQKAEEEAAAARIAAMQQASAGAGPTGSVSLPVVYSVTGGSALLLVPGVGETYVQAGTTLPGGLKVLSVSNVGVAVEQGESRFMLGFGTSAGGNTGLAQQ